MTERVYPSAQKLNPPPAATVPITNGYGPTPGGGGGAAPPTKTTQLYTPNRPRPIYRPPQDRGQSRSCSGRRCCCLCFLYTLITILILILLAAIAACIFYFLYHPKNPSFSVTQIRTARFNLTNPDQSGFAHLNSRFEFTLTAKNPNSKKITFVYDPISVSLATARVPAGNATLPAFTHVAGNTTVLHGTVTSDPKHDLDSESIGSLKSDIKKKTGFPITIEMNTKVEVKMGKIKTKKVGVRVTCEGIKGILPKSSKGKMVNSPGVISSSKCKVDLRIKIWKFTF